MISEFKGEYRFLSNFYKAPFIWEGFYWDYSENAFQAAKTDRSTWSIIAELTPGQAKLYGRSVELRHDWEEIKIDRMRDILFAKFTQNPPLLKALMDTGDEVLEEGNNWNDRYWGVCPPNSGDGLNHLGIRLMYLRDYLR